MKIRVAPTQAYIKRKDSEESVQLPFMPYSLYDMAKAPPRRRSVLFWLGFAGVVVGILYCYLFW